MNNDDPVKGSGQDYGVDDVSYPRGRLKKKDKAMTDPETQMSVQDSWF